MTKLPHIQFYTGDWLKEPRLKFVSLAAQGLWINLLCHMNESHVRGVLVNHKGTPYTRAEIAVLLGKNLVELNPLFDELEHQEVYSIDGRGAIYCRRLVRDEEFRRQKEENGKKGGRPKNDDAPPPPHPENQTNNQNYNQDETKMKPNIKPNIKPNSDIDNDIGYGSGFSNSLYPSNAEGWDELCELAAKAQMSFDPSPGSDLCVKVWCRLGMGDKHEIVASIRRRIEAGEFGPEVDPQYVPRLENYIGRKKYRDSIRPRTAQLQVVGRKPDVMAEARALAKAQADKRRVS